MKILGPIIVALIAGLVSLVLTSMGLALLYDPPVPTGALLVSSLIAVGVGSWAYGRAQERWKEGYTLIARDSSCTKASKLDGTEYDSEEAAKAALRDEWPDVMPGPEFELTGQGRPIAAAINELDLYMATDEAEESVWILVTESASARKAGKALKRLLQYWERRHQG